jgi:hypothetical protein
VTTDASEIGLKMMRHAQLTNGAGLPATVTVDDVWQVGSYMNIAPVLRIQGSVVRDDRTRCARRASGLAEQDPQQVPGTVAHQVVRAVEHVCGP